MSRSLFRDVTTVRRLIPSQGKMLPNFTQFQWQVVAWYKSGLALRTFQKPMMDIVLLWSHWTTFLRGPRHVLWKTILLRVWLSFCLRASFVTMVASRSRSIIKGANSSTRCSLSCIGYLASSNMLLVRTILRLIDSSSARTWLSRTQSWSPSVIAAIGSSVCLQYSFRVSHITSDDGKVFQKKVNSSNLKTYLTLDKDTTPPPAKRRNESDSDDTSPPLPPTNRQNSSDSDVIAVKPVYQDWQRDGTSALRWICHLFVGMVDETNMMLNPIASLLTNLVSRVMEIVCSKHLVQSLHGVRTTMSFSGQWQHMNDSILYANLDTMRRVWSK